MVNLSPHHFWLSFTIAGIATCCAFLTINLIYRLTKVKSNGYLFAIFVMSICQLFYDSSFFLIIDQSQSQTSTISLWRASIFLNTFGNVSSLLWTNCLSATVLYIAIYQRSLDLLNHKYIVLTITIVPSLILAILQLLSSFPLIASTPSESANKLVLVVQWALVFINLVLSIMSGYFVYKITKASRLAEASGKFNHTIQARAKAIELLAKRMRLYPLFQILSRSLLIWFEFYCSCSSVAEDLVVGDWSNSLAPEGAFVLYEIFAPCASIGYFVIFLIVQPHARSELRSMFGCKSLLDDEADRLQKLFSLDYNIQTVYPPLANGNTKSVRLANGQTLSDNSSRRSVDVISRMSPWDMIDIDDLNQLDENSLAMAIDRKAPGQQTSTSSQSSSSRATSPFISFFARGNFFNTKSNDNTKDIKDITINNNNDNNKNNDNTFAIRESGYSFY